jgi:hypothetical protein
MFSILRAIEYIILTKEIIIIVLISNAANKKIELFRETAIIFQATAAVLISFLHALFYKGSFLLSAAGQPCPLLSSGRTVTPQKANSSRGRDWMRISGQFGESLWICCDNLLFHFSYHSFCSMNSYLFIILFEIA